MLSSSHAFVKSIFAAAHAMTREAVKAYGGADYRATFGAALRRAWRDAKKAARVEKYTADAGRAAVAALTDWATLDDAGKVDAIRRAVWSAAARHGAFIGIPAADVLTDDINAYVNETWLHIGGKLDSSAENAEKITARNVARAKIAVPALTLNALLMQPARAAIAQIYRDTRKHAAHDVHGYTDDDGAEFDPFALIAALDDVEAAAVAAAAVEKFAATRDEIDRAIINRNGKTTRQLAAELRISAMAISKRAAKMRRDWYAFIA